ncbi:MAG: cytochrome c biogenesis protein CcdA [Candidatus Omnitrophota bacterium]|nr:cytochrome c biogenesis protein CcdA [Candidatus Omnitrophota bacterium]
MTPPSENISLLVAFVAGVLTFLSPCLLPMIPAFIAYITGISFSDLKNTKKKRTVIGKTLANSLLFVVGFSVVFVLLGLTATAVGRALFRYQQVIRIAGGIFIMLLGAYLAGLLKLDFLAKERRLNIRPKGASYLGSFLFGVTFAAAWTPCAGPILGSILVFAGTRADVAHGAKLLAAYSMGVGLPFILAGLAVNSFLELFERFKKLISAINVVAGVFLIIVGLLTATNYMSVLSERFLGAFTR